MTPRVHAAFALAASTVVAAALAWGFYLVGSPMDRRQVRFDEQRLQDLQTIAREIRLMVVDSHGDKNELKEALPKTLAEAIERARDQQINSRDPDTGAPYEYTVKNDSTFEICAQFARPRDWDSDVFWNHAAGKHCYTINVLDPPP
jgi:hypothetical protein